MESYSCSYYDGTNFGHTNKEIILYNKEKQKEREIGMSYCCAYLLKNKIYIGADSRETMMNGSYNDNFQKVYINKQENMIWGMSGLIKSHHLNYVYLVNNILNKPKVPIQTKLKLIEVLMNNATQETFRESVFQDSRYDLFVAFIQEGNICLYTFESLNGIITIKSTHKDNYTIASGVHTDEVFKLSNEVLEFMQEDSIVENITNIINNVKNKKTPQSLTVGGDICIATMDNEGHIKTYVNGEEKPFKIM